MSWQTTPDIWNLVTALIISMISGIISISRKILRGHPSTFLWVVSEFLTAILCGYLMYHSYPQLDPSIPDEITRPVATAIAAHIGGRVFQELEAMFLERYIPFLKQRK
jgi:hypothetical protein